MRDRRSRLYSPYSLSFLCSVLRLMPRRAAALICTPSQAAITWAISSRSTRLTIWACRFSAFAGRRTRCPVRTSSAASVSRSDGAADAAAACRRHGLGQQIEGQLVAGGQDHGPLDVVLQLADVARPVVVVQGLASPPARSRGTWRSFSAVVDLQEVARPARGCPRGARAAAAGGSSPRSAGSRGPRGTGRPRPLRAGRGCWRRPRGCRRGWSACRRPARTRAPAARAAA